MFYCILIQVFCIRIFIETQFGIEFFERGLFIPSFWLKRIVKDFKVLVVLVHFLPCKGSQIL